MTALTKFCVLVKDKPDKQAIGIVLPKGEKTTSQEFKELYLDHVGQSSDTDLRVVFAGKQLHFDEPNKTLGDFGVKHQSTLFVMFRVPGGFMSA
jgi:hypothetical protein